MAYKRKTKDEYTVQGNYGEGWEDLCASDNRKEAREDLKAYRENDNTGIFRMIKRRVKIDA